VSLKLTRIPETWSARWFAELWDGLLSDSSTLAGHVAATDPHTQYTTDAEVAAAAAAQITTHVGATDPHPDLIDELPTATVVAEADLVIVSQSGTNKQATVELLGEAVFGDEYDDLVIPGTAINPTGAAGAATLNQNTGLLEFSGTADQVCVFSWQLNHGWSGAYQDDDGMAIVIPHMHVRFLTATATNTRWKFEYDVAGVDQDFANAYEAWTTLDTVTKANPNNARRHAIVSFGNLDLPGKTISTIVHGRVTRLASSDGADNYTGLVALYSADLHIRRRRWGTEAEYT
jgi:hypothetical protein